jgi:cobalt/nickel transport system ATP-binding protein
MAELNNGIALEASGLHYHYDGQVCALQGIDLTVRQGRRLAVLGANGAGKSTLFLHLNGTLKPERGGIWIKGEKAEYSRRGLLNWRQQVGLVFQNPDDQLFAPTVEQDVSFGPMNLNLEEREVRERVDEALSALGIENLRRRPTHSLSFGQKKRAAIAGAVAMRPDVLILDEPSAGLDPQGVNSLMIVLDELLLRGTTLVMATHDIELACGWADEIALLRAGKVLRQGETEFILSNESLMNAAELRMPLALELGARLQAMGWLPRDLALPRTREALLEWFDAATVSSAVKKVASR